jgi:TolB-like protein/tetratricopeptide (TPR) repeat protein
MADVFLSYKRGDAAKVRKLVAALRAAGLETWWDEDIPPSAPWETTIEQELARAKAVIVCWSPDAVASDNVRSEARVAREDGRLIQVFLKPCQPPLFFGEHQGVNLSKWRGNPDDPRIAALADSARKIAAGERIAVEPRKQERSWFDYRVHVALAALIVLAGSLAGWWLLAPAKAQGPQTLAVLPFRALNPADANLVDAVWDDTRGAISKNPNLRVLGREAVTALAKRDLTPAEYRKKVGADYLLDGSVEHVRDQVRIKLSLTRTSDGAEVWSDEIGGKLDDVFTFQQQVAREVEGRVRGRVAPGGGAKPQNIATTGEVYSIYADARALIRKRDSQNFHAAAPLLKKALAIDPNFAPAWASLGQITGMGLFRTPDISPVQQRRDAVTYLNRALQLAPSLAHAHAALAMVQNSPPELDGEYRKAIQLDPNDAEIWGWYANALQGENRLAEALAARNRVVEIEPLWYWSSVNKIGTLGLMQDWKGIEAELARTKATGDPVLFAKSQWMAANVRGRPGDEVRILLQLRAAHADEASWVDNRIFAPLMQLGFIEEAAVAWHWPAYVLPNYRGTPDSAKVIKHDFPKPTDLWTDGDESMELYGRLLPKNGRSKEYIGYYDAAFRSPEEMFALYEYNPGQLINTAPTVAAILRIAGRAEEADKILARVDQLIAPGLKNGAPNVADLSALAYVRGAQGRDGEAVKFLGQAVAQGWLPDRRFQAIDIADEPCFAQLVNRPDFQAIRQRIFARIEEERRKVPLNLLAQAYPVKPTKAAA